MAEHFFYIRNNLIEQRMSRPASQHAL